MGRIWKRDGGLEGRLRDERPRPSDEFVTRVAEDVAGNGARRRPRVRLGLAAGLTGAAATAAVVLGGGISPITPIQDGFDQAKSSAAKSSPANEQYSQNVTICHNGNTLKLSQQGADNHLQNHPSDTAGPCPGGDDGSSDGS